MNYYDLAMQHADIANWQEATKSLQKAKEENPKCPIIRRMLSIGLLTTGRIKEGLEEFEHRFEMPLPNSPQTAMAFEIGPKIRHRFPKPYWDGKTDLTNKTILVFNEGGHGDIIQNVRYLPLLKAKKVILEAKKDVFKLLQGIEGVDEVISCGPTSSMLFFEKPYNCDKVDYVVSLHSLMYYFDPNLDNIPCKFPYIFPKPGPQIVDGSGLKIGIVWAGIQGHGNDHRRSCFKKYFSPLTKIGTVFDLQKGEMIRDWGDLRANIGSIDLGPYLNDFNDTALAIQDLDVVVSVDTSVGHLAGAMNKLVWTVLPHKEWAEWRWQRKWYDSQRIRFQKTNWEDLLLEVTEEIRVTICEGKRYENYYSRQPMEDQI